MAASSIGQGLKCGLLLLGLCAASAWAGVEGSISGTVTDPQGVAVANAPVKVLTSQGAVVKETTSSATGDFQFFPLTFGSYELVVEATEYSPYQSTVYVSSGGTSQVDVHLLSKRSEEHTFELQS